MKKIVVSTIVISLSLFTFACNRQAEDITENNDGSGSPEQVSTESTEVSPTMAGEPPDSPMAINSDDDGIAMGIITQMTQGDLMCYVDVTDSNSGETYGGLGATFEVCEQGDNFLNQNSKFIYTTANVNDCEGIDPCGKTREAQLISQVVVIGEDWQTMDNGEWTLTLGRWESWDGVNNSGDVTYYGCDRSDNCLYLEEGKVICRDGSCSVGWSNGNYSYVVSTPITEEETNGDSTLTVTENGNILMEATGFKNITSSLKY